MDPTDRVQREPGRCTTGIRAPTALGAALRHLAGPDEDDVAPTDLDTLGFQGCVEVGCVDRLARFEPRHALEGRHVEQDAAPDDPVARLGDVVADRALAADVGRVVAVVDMPVEHDVPEGVPLRPGLQRQDQQIVRAPDPAIATAVEVTHRRAGRCGVAVADHQVDAG